MKKSVLCLVLIGVLFASAAFVSADSAPLTSCRPTIELINQDPYPANPGEYVKVVFQLDGLNNPDCEKVSLELQDGFPFSLDPGETQIYEFLGDTYVRNYKSTALAPYKLRVDEDAIDGDNEMEVVLKYIDDNGDTTSEIHQFDINVEGVKVDFEIHVRDFVASTNSLTFEILNIGEGDVEALVVEVPKQDNVVVKGSNVEIIGDLDSNEDTTFKYEAQPKDGEIDLAISYTDEINVRRQVIKKVYYDSSYFTGRKSDEVQPKSAYYYLFWLLVLIIVVIWVRKWWKKRKKRKEDGRKK